MAEDGAGPATWRRLWNADYQTYYYMSQDGQSSWTAPEGAVIIDDAAAAVPAPSESAAQDTPAAGATDTPAAGAAEQNTGAPQASPWIRQWSADYNMWYYTHSVTGESSWSQPADYVPPAEDSVASAPASPAAVDGGEVAAADTTSAVGGAAATGASDTPVSNWNRQWSTDYSRWYFVHKVTGESSWEQPTDYIDPEAAAAAPVAPAKEAEAPAAGEASAVVEAPADTTLEEQPAVVDAPNPTEAVVAPAEVVPAEVVPAEISPAEVAPPAPAPPAPAPATSDTQDGTDASAPPPAAAPAVAPHAHNKAVPMYDAYTEEEASAKPFTKDEFLGFAKHFHAIDTSRSGYITVESMRTFAIKSKTPMSDEELRDLIADKDFDNDGRVSFREFIAASLRPAPLQEDWFWTHVFDRYATADLPSRTSSAKKLGATTKTFGGKVKSSGPGVVESPASARALTRAALLRVLECMEMAFAEEDVDAWMAAGEEAAGERYLGLDAFLRITVQ